MESDKTIQEVVVVEGYHDLARLKAIYPNLDVVITNGSEISTETLKELKTLNQSRGLILFLDPDYQGERIRRIINDYVGTTSHAFLPKEKCISKNKKKVGIEHADNQDLIKALQNVLTTTFSTNTIFTIVDLQHWGLVGHKDAKQKRKQLTENLGIGLCNGKTLLNKLHMFNITKDQIINALEE